MFPVSIHKQTSSRQTGFSNRVKHPQNGSGPENDQISTLGVSSLVSVHIGCEFYVSCFNALQLDRLIDGCNRRS